MFESSKLNDLLQTPAGWYTTDALFLTYSLHPEVLVSVLTDCGLLMTYADKPEEIKKHFLCLMQHDRYLEGALPSLFSFLLKCGRIRPVKGSCSFHPKLIALVYRKNDDDKQKKLRLIISSKNLTTATYLEGAVSIEGTPEEQAVKEKTPLAKMIEDVSEQDKFAKDIAELIRQTDFTKDIRSILADENAQYELLTVGGGCKLKLPQNPQKLRIVSPFLGSWNFLSSLIGSCRDWKVFTRRKVPQELVKMAGPEHFWCLPYSEKEEVPAPELHAKIYALTDCDGRHHLYIGSANCSENGFRHNYELMLHIKSDTYDFTAALDKATGHFSGKPLPVDTSEDTLPEGYPLPDIQEAEQTLLAKLKKETEQEMIVHFFCEILQCSVDRENYLETAASVIVGMNKEELRERVLKYCACCKGRIPDSIERYIRELLLEADNNE